MTTVHQPPRRRPTPVDRLADGHLAGMLRLSPEFATMVGTPDADQTSLSDYSPEGTAAWRDLLAGTLSQLDGLVPADGVDAVTVSAMRERIGSDLDLVEAGETTGELNVLSSPIQSIRDVFNLMPAHTDEDRAAIGARLAAVTAGPSPFAWSPARRSRCDRSNAAPTSATTSRARPPPSSGSPTTARAWRARSARPVPPTASWRPSCGRRSRPGRRRWTPWAASAIRVSRAISSEPP